MSKKAEKESFSRCPETCPAVDEAIDELLSDLGPYIATTNEAEVTKLVNRMRETIKQVGTEKLRDALTACCDERLDLKAEVDSLASQLDALA